MVRKGMEVVFGRRMHRNIIRAAGVRATKSRQAGLANSSGPFVTHHDHRDFHFHFEIATTRQDFVSILKTSFVFGSQTQHGAKAAIIQKKFFGSKLNETMVTADQFC